MLNISERIAALPPEGLQQLADKLLAVQLIGFFLNTLALRTDLLGNPTVRDLLGRGEGDDAWGLCASGPAA